MTRSDFHCCYPPVGEAASYSGAFGGLGSAELLFVVFSESVAPPAEVAQDSQSGPSHMVPIVGHFVPGTLAR